AHGERGDEFPKQDIGGGFGGRRLEGAVEGNGLERHGGLRDGSVTSTARAAGSYGGRRNLFPARSLDDRGDRGGQRVEIWAHEELLAATDAVVAVMGVDHGAHRRDAISEGVDDELGHLVLPEARIGGD